MTAARDVNGTLIAVGDRVAFCMAGVSQNMRVAHVVRIMPKMVELDVRHEWVREGKGITRNHSAVVVCN